MSNLRNHLKHKTSHKAIVGSGIFYNRWHISRLLAIGLVFVFATVASYFIFFSHAASSLSADFNSDSVVNVTDLSILATNWGRTTATHAQGDANSDGTINIYDLSILASQWGQTISTPPGNTVNVSPGDNLQAAIDSLGTGGGTVNFAAGTYTLSTPLKLPAGNTAPMILSGYGATIKLTSNPPRFLVWNRTAEGQTFRNFTVEGFTVDAQNLHSSGAQWSVVIGDMYSGGYWDPYFLNLENITVQDITALNVPTDPANSYQARGIALLLENNASSGYTVHGTNLLVSNCHVEGGNSGVWVQGNGDGEMNMDQVAIRNSWHDTKVTAWTNPGSSSNFQLGQSAHVGTGDVSGNTGYRSGDDGVEVNNCSSCTSNNNTIYNPFYQCYVYASFNTPLTGAGQVSFNNDVGNVSVDQNSLGGGSYGLSLGQYSSVPFGIVNINNFTYNLTVTGDHRALYITSDVMMSALNVNGFTVTHASDPNNWPNNYYIAVTPKSGTVNLQNVYINAVKAY